MKISLEVIRRVESSAIICCPNVIFDYVDVLGFSSKPCIEPFARVLWVASYSRGRDDSWYGLEFERLDYLIKQTKAYPNTVALVEQSMAVPDTPYIQVRNIPEFLERLLVYCVGEVMPIVIGVTGSVGKTTCVAMLEDVLDGHGPTLRLYTKRIAPLSLYELVINQLESKHRFLVMEYSMYFKNHIAELVRLLPPKIGILLNIESPHIGIDGIQTPADIWKAKSVLLEKASYAIIESEVTFRMKAKLVSWRVAYDAQTYSPFIESILQYKQIAVIEEVLRYLFGSVSAVDVAALNMFTPKEHRLSKIFVRGVACFFDGEVTNAARLHAWSQSMYKHKTLILHYTCFFEQSIHLVEHNSQIIAALKAFDAVYCRVGVHKQFKQVGIIFKDVDVVFYETFPEIMQDSVVFLH